MKLFVGAKLTISVWQFEAWEIPQHFVAFKWKCFENPICSRYIFFLMILTLSVRTGSIALSPLGDLHVGHTDRRLAEIC